MKRTAVALTFLLLAGCGGSGGQAPAGAPSSPPQPPPTTTAPGPQAFLEYAHNAQLGTKDLKNAPDEPLLRAGNFVCQGLDVGPYGGVVQGMVGSNTKPTAQQADEFARKAVENLCPQHKGKLP